MKTITKGWKLERKLRQSKNLQKSKPWEKSTGPKTNSGKSKSAQNAYKHGARSAEFKELADWLQRQSRIIKIIKQSVPHQKWKENH